MTPDSYFTLTFLRKEAKRQKRAISALPRISAEARVTEVTIGRSVNPKTMEPETQPERWHISAATRAEQISLRWSRPFLRKFTTCSSVRTSWLNPAVLKALLHGNL